MKLSLFDYPQGLQTIPGYRAVYNFRTNTATLGATKVEGHALMWELDGVTSGALLTSDLNSPPQKTCLMRCDRVDFPPNGIAYLHTHPGGGIRYILQGSLRVETKGESHTYSQGQAWFESGEDPVYAEASATEETSFVRVMILPAEWKGKRTIRYVNAEDNDKPKLQVATILFDELLT